MTIAPDPPVAPFEPDVPGVRHTMLDLAETVYQHMPGCRAEIINGTLVVNPLPDATHARCLTDLLLALPHETGGAVAVHGLGLWLSTGEHDHVVPDLSVVDEDFTDHEVTYNCLPASVFRMVAEITSANPTYETVVKSLAYAGAGVPVYLIGDRTQREAVLLTEPLEGSYRRRAVYRPGESFMLPESVGAEVEIDVDTLLGRS